MSAAPTAHAACPRTRHEFVGEDLIVVGSSTKRKASSSVHTHTETGARPSSAFRPGGSIDLHDQIRTTTSVASRMLPG